MPYLLCTQINIFLTSVALGSVTGFSFMQVAILKEINDHMHTMELIFLQHLLLLVRCTHQSMPIRMTLSPELRVIVPTVGAIHLILFQEVSIQKNTSICDGTQLKLTDSNFGQEQYQPTDHYVWISRSDEQLLFIFPRRVSLTTITLHYYSDSD